MLADDNVTTGKDVFGFKTPKKSGGMALKAAEEVNRTTPKSTRKIYLTSICHLHSLFSQYSTLNILSFVWRTWFGFTFLNT